MKRLLLSLALLSAFAFAQEPAPVPDAPSAVSHFSVSASAMGFSGSGSATASSIVGGEVNLTHRFAIGYEQVLIPTLDANYYFGTVSYTMPLSSLVGKKINSQLVFDASHWQTRFFAGAGVLRQKLVDDQKQHVASTVGIGLNYVANGKVTIEVISGQWLHAHIAGPLNNQFVFTPDTAAISSGLKLTF